MEDMRKTKQQLVGELAELSQRITELEASIAQHKQAEEMLRESEDKYRTVFETTVTATVIIEEDTTISLANSEFEKLSGYSREEIEGNKSWTEFVVEEDLERMEEYHRLRRIDPDAAPKRYEFRFIDRKGDVKDILLAVDVIPGTKKSVASLLDITERKQTEGKIKRAAEEWRVTFDSIADLVSIHDKDFKLVRVNKAYADAFKMEPKELIGKTCYKVFHGTKEPPPNCPHKQTLETKKPHTAEFFEPHLGLHVEFSTSPIFNEKGEIVGTVHIAKDITERKRMQEQLMVTDRLASIGELASGVAHELNNPLTGIIGFSDLLVDKEDLPDDVKEDLKVINREAQRTSRIVRNLLTFARKHPQEKQSVDISSTIEKVLELRAYEQKVNNIEVNTRFAPDLPEITANAFDLQQVFLNIIINAEHFMIEAHRGGTLTITTERVGDIIRASFADDGPGIAKENLTHVFDPFFTTKQVGKGTGLGLSICHGIVTEHGGRIYAESELGKGATFIVELPIRQ